MQRKLIQAFVIDLFSFLSPIFFRSSFTACSQVSPKVWLETELLLLRPSKARQKLQCLLALPSLWVPLCKHYEGRTTSASASHFRAIVAVRFSATVIGACVSFYRSLPVFLFFFLCLHSNMLPSAKRRQNTSGTAVQISSPEVNCSECSSVRVSGRKKKRRVNTGAHVPNIRKRCKRIE